MFIHNLGHVVSYLRLLILWGLLSQLLELLILHKFNLHLPWTSMVTFKFTLQIIWPILIKDCWSLYLQTHSSTTDWLMQSGTHFTRFLASILLFIWHEEIRVSCWIECIGSTIIFITPWSMNQTAFLAISINQRTFIKWIYWFFNNLGCLLFCQALNLVITSLL